MDVPIYILAWLSYQIFSSINLSLYSLPPKAKSVLFSFLLDGLVLDLVLYTFYRKLSTLKGLFFSYIIINIVTV